MPPQRRKTKIDTTPIVMPQGMLITPLDSRLNTSPSAVTWPKPSPGS